MSTIKSSSANLTLNADGSGNDIKFQSNAVEVGSLTDAGLFSTTAVTVTGAVTAASLDISGNIDIDGTTNLDVVDIDGAVDMASTLQVDGAITSSTGATITTADNTDTLSLISTDADANAGPNLRLYRNSGSPADSDVLGRIDFEGRNDNSQDVVYGAMRSAIEDASDGTEDAKLVLYSMVGGTERNRLEFNPAQAVFNENAQDIDVRIESSSKPNMFKVDANGGDGSGSIGINESSPAAKQLHITSGDVGTIPTLRVDFDEVCIENSTCGITFTTMHKTRCGLVSMAVLNFRLTQMEIY